MLMENISNSCICLTSHNRTMGGSGKLIYNLPDGMSLEIPMGREVSKAKVYNGEC